MLYYFDQHPQRDLYTSLCSKYMEHSRSQKDQEIARKRLKNQLTDQQMRLDSEFAERLRKFD